MQKAEKLKQLYEQIERLKAQGKIVNTYGGVEGEFDHPDGEVLTDFMEYIYEYWQDEERPVWMVAFLQVLCWQFQSCHEGVYTYYENFYGMSEYALIVRTAEFLQQNGYLELYKWYQHGMTECEQYNYPADMQANAAEVDKWINWHTEEVWDFCVDLLAKHKEEWIRRA